MFRYKIIIEYDGSEFAGWQKQQHNISVQGAIETAIFSFTRDNVIVYGAGRTDAGVHALGQVAHFDLHRYYSPHVIQSAINHFIKSKISILHVEEAEPHFHARFDAIKKRYIYQIIHRKSPLALMKNKAWLIKDELDIPLMQQASAILIGTHDFSSFRNARCQGKNPIKTINDIQISKTGDMVQLSFEAKSFLHNQVRIMTGTLKDIGIGKINVNQLQYILEQKNRQYACNTAPPYGLYLERIWY